MPKAAEAALKTYVVEGSKYGEFPLDMLRRDDALPYGEDQAALVDRLCAFGEGKQDLPKLVRVTIASKSRFAPNVQRWESFGWRVVECSDPCIVLSAPRGTENFAAVQEATIADYHEALASLTPRQAWAAKLHRAINVEVARKLATITPSQARTLTARGDLEAHVDSVRATVTMEMLRAESSRAARKPKQQDDFLRDIRHQIEQEFPGHRLSETFLLGDTVYAVVRGRHMTQFAVMVDGSKIERVFN